VSFVVARRHLKKARPENVRRLAKWLKVGRLDEMSDRQLVKFLDWLFKRPEKRARGLTTW